MSSITIYTVHSSFPKIETEGYVYQQMFQSLRKARKFVEQISLESENSKFPLVRILQGPPKSFIMQVLKENETFHNLPIGKWKQEMCEERADLIGSNVRYYTITAYRLKTNDNS